jgi:hypothetical protein
VAGRTCRFGSLAPVSLVAESPPGMSIPVEMLLHNKRILERRLRDLGVLVGVNDKCLRQWFRAVGDKV